MLFFPGSSLSAETQNGDYVMVIDSRHDFSLDEFDIHEVQTVRMRYKNSQDENDLSMSTYLVIKVGRWHEPLIIPSPW